MDTIALIVTLVLASYGFTAGGYIFTFRYVRSSAEKLWASIEKTRDDMKADIEKVQDKINKAVDNDLRHLEDRVARLEQKS